MINETFVNNLIEFGQKLSEEIVDIQNSDFKISSKSDDSPLTQADLHSNKEIKKFLLENSSVSNFKVLSIVSMLSLFFNDEIVS